MQMHGGWGSGMIGPQNEVQTTQPPGARGRSLADGNKAMVAVTSSGDGNSQVNPCLGT